MEERGFTYQGVLRLEKGLVKACQEPARKAWYGRKGGHLFQLRKLLLQILSSLLDQEVAQVNACQTLLCRVDGVENGCLCILRWALLTCKAMADSYDLYPDLQLLKTMIDPEHFWWLNDTWAHWFCVPCYPLKGHAPKKLPLLHALLEDAFCKTKNQIKADTLKLIHPDINIRKEEKALELQATFMCKDFCQRRSDGWHESSVKDHKRLLRHAAMEKAKNPPVIWQPGLQVPPWVFGVMRVHLTATQ